MENIIRKAIEGGYEVDTSGYWLWLGDNSYNLKLGERVKRLLGTDAASLHEIINDTLFWQSLGKACGWAEDDELMLLSIKQSHLYWKQVALHFHEINLTEGWEKAVEYLSELVK